MHPYRLFGGSSYEKQLKASSSWNLRTYRERLIWLVHGDAVHADLNRVSCWDVARPVTEVQLDGLDWMDGWSETQAD